MRVVLPAISICLIVAVVVLLGLLARNCEFPSAAMIAEEDVARQLKGQRLTHEWMEVGLQDFCADLGRLTGISILPTESAIDAMSGRTISVWIEDAPLDGVLTKMIALPNGLTWRIEAPDVIVDAP